VLISTDNFDRTFQVNNGSAAVDLLVTGNMTSSGSLRGWIKNGTGTMLISGNNNWSGQTKIVEGTLRLGSSTALPSLGRSVAFQGGVAAANTTNPVLDINGQNTAVFAILLNLNNPAVAGIQSSVVDSTSEGLLTLGADVLYHAGGEQQNGQSTISANLDLGTASRTFTVNDSSIAATDLLISGAISGTADSGLTKTGAGVLELTGSNTYSGDTTVNAGTLSLSSTNSNNDASAISIEAGAILALNFVGTETVSSLIIDGVSQPSGVYGAAEFPGTITGTGTITVASAPSDPFLTWSGGAPFNGDANNDGVENGLAWLLGAANPNLNALGLLPTISKSGDHLQMNFSMLNAASRSNALVELQHSSDLGISDPWASISVPETHATVSGVSFLITPNGNMNQVQANIPTTEAASGKLFGRLKAEN
jgi:autotransporter-associated beta strand protein